MERTRATKWLPIVGLEKLGRPLRWYHRLTWRVCKVARWILRIQTHGMEAIPKTGGAVVIAPHFSYSDSFPCLYTALPRPPRFLASAFFATAHPVASWLAFLGGVIPARRDHPDPGAVRRVLRLLANGELVVLFPEGGRTWAGSPTAPMRSAAKLLGRLRVPLYVASIEG
ncbi:MAG TPA: lysophospholipid acyltransferase family protein, partial [Myxococcales bacterium]|nr:lysophospholipid acyltransferase family protein [Myxococcales bacterium]